MKYLCLFTALVALPVHALTISNLDEVEHQVVFEEVQGSKVIRRVAPAESIYSAAGGGRVYIKGKPEMAVRIEELDRLVIWPQGNLQIQMRRKNRSSGN